MLDGVWVAYSLVYVGLPTVMNIFGERTVPWLLDRYLAKTGYGSQHTSKEVDPEAHDNLFDPVDEDRGARGPFDEKAHRRSIQLELAKRRAALLLTGTGLAAAAAGIALIGNGR